MAWRWPCARMRPTKRWIDAHDLAACHAAHGHQSALGAGAHARRSAQPSARRTRQASPGTKRHAICRRRCRDLPQHRRTRSAILREAAAKKNGKTLNMLTHCNAGWLACVDWGTALAPIYMAHDAGIPLHVWVDETRPRNQGASLTAFELGGHGVTHTIIADNAGGHYMQAGEVDLCIVGTDRVTANGDVANKIGTYLKALAAQGQRRAVLCSVAVVDHRLDAGERPRHSHRGTLLRRTSENDGPLARRRARHGRDCRTRQPGRQSGLRRDAGSASSPASSPNAGLALPRPMAFCPSSPNAKGNSLMKSRWSDADVQSFIKTLCRQRRERGSGRARLHHAAAWAAIRSSCCMAAATPRSRRT